MARGPKPAGAAVAMPGFPNTSSTHRTRPAIFPVRGLVTKVVRGVLLVPERLPSVTDASSDAQETAWLFSSVFLTKARGSNTRH